MLINAGYNLAISFNSVVKDIQRAKNILRRAGGLFGWYRSLFIVRPFDYNHLFKKLRRSRYAESPPAYSAPCECNMPIRRARNYAGFKVLLNLFVVVDVACKSEICLRFHVVRDCTKNIHKEWVKKFVQKSSGARVRKSIEFMNELESFKH